MSRDAMFLMSVFQVWDARVLKSEVEEVLQRG